MNRTRRQALLGAALVSAVPALPVLAQPAAKPAPGPGEPGSSELAPSSVIANVAGRGATPLDGRWKIIADPFDITRRKPRDRRTVWKDLIEQPGQTIIEYEWESSPDFDVPGDWNTQVRELHLYDGTAYFRRLFDAPPPAPGRRRFLVFDAVNYRSTVWLNQTRLGGHEGGFTPFSFEVTAQLKSGRNLLVVRADSRHDAESLPAVDFDWHNQGGITRSVWLLDVPQTFVRHWSLRLHRGRLLAQAQLDGAGAADTPVELTIPALGVRLQGRPDAQGRVALEAAAPPALRRWSPEQPTLYDVLLTAGEDNQRERIGLREIEVRGKEVLLNGEPVFLRGISLHEEALGSAGGRHVGAEQARALLGIAKRLNCNFVRLAHYPHGEAMLRAADEMGLMVWAEIPVYWEEVSYGSAKTLALARTMFTEMIERDANRAAVVMWSVANETPETAPRLAFLTDVVAHVRRLDGSRLITAALNKNADVGGAREGQKRFTVDDPLGAVLDVIGFNQYEGWYSQLPPDQFHSVSFSSPWDKPLVMSEFGADARLGFRAERHVRWSEDFQAWLFEETLKVVDRIPGIAGLTPWLLKDFRSPRRWHGRFQQNWNRKGVVSENGEPKLAFGVLERYYARRRAMAAAARAGRP